MHIFISSIFQILSNSYIFKYKNKKITFKTQLTLKKNTYLLKKI